MTISEAVKYYRGTRRELVEQLAQAALDAGIRPHAEPRWNATEKVARVLMSEVRLFPVREITEATGLTAASVYTGLDDLRIAGRIAVSYRAFTKGSSGPR